jgi:hypothetical protein
VREALVKSQACTTPPERFQSSQLSTVPMASSPEAARANPSGVCSNSQRALLAENRGSMPSPVRSAIKPAAPRRRSSSQ